MAYKYQIATRSRDHYRNVLTCLMALGYEYCGHRLGSVNEVVESDYERYPVIVIDPGAKHLSGNSECGSAEMAREKRDHPGVPVVTLEKFIDEISQPVLEVVLNKCHVARVTQEGVEVGCQKFTFGVIEELAEAIRKVKSN